MGYNTIADVSFVRVEPAAGQRSLRVVACALL